MKEVNWQVWKRPSPSYNRKEIGKLYAHKGLQLELFEAGARLLFRKIVDALRTGVTTKKDGV